MSKQKGERPSNPHDPVQFGPLITDAVGPCTQWENNRWFGVVRRFSAGFPIGGGPYAIIGISAKDGTARHDWRDFQNIKNDIVGAEWEGAELYPADSRLVDPSNRFYLWCVPKGVFVWGWDHRRVLDADDRRTLAPQRPFPHGLTNGLARKTVEVQSILQDISRNPDHE